MKKLKTKKKMKMKTIVTIVMVIFLLTLSTGYSYLHAKLKIEGKATIAAKNIKTENYEKGQSVSSWNIVAQLRQGNSPFEIYDIKMTIVNNDGNVDSWEIGMDVPDSYVESKLKTKCASNAQYNNGRLILYSESWNGKVNKGEILTLEFQIALKNDTKLDIKNITFNGLLTQ